MTLPALAVATACQIGAAASVSLSIVALGPATQHAQSAVILVLLLAAAIHSAIGAIFGAWCLWRWHAGFVSKLRNLDLRLAGLWHDYAAVIVAVCAASALFVQAGSDWMGQR